MFSKITLAQFFTNVPYLESGCKQANQRSDLKSSSFGQKRKYQSSKLSVSKLLFAFFNENSKRPLII